jgi:hypothetical protein
MKAAYDSCIEAGAEPPKKVMEFFDWEAPDDAGIKVDLRKTDAVSEYAEEMIDGYEVDILKLPGHITKIRFYTCY